MSWWFFGSHCCYYVFKHIKKKQTKKKKKKKLSLNYVTIKSLKVYNRRIHCFVYRPTSKRNQHTRFKGRCTQTKIEHVLCPISKIISLVFVFLFVFWGGSHQNMFDVSSGGIKGARGGTASRSLFLHPHLPHLRRKWHKWASFVKFLDFSPYRNTFSPSMPPPPNLVSPLDVIEVRDFPRSRFVLFPVPWL